jgi:uncharacterized protein (TIGR03437 family)
VALKAPRNVAVDTFGNVFFSDFGGHRVYEVTAAGALLRLAGTGTAGLSGDDGPALQAKLNSPAGISVDPNGTVYIADSANGRVRKVWRGLISSLGDTGSAGAPLLVPLGIPTGLALDSDGSLAIADPGNGRVVRVTPLGEITFVNQTARDLALDAAGSLYLCSGAYVYKRSRNGLVSVAAGNGKYADSGDGGDALKARFNQPSGIARDASGALYVADRANHRVRRISPDGMVVSVAGNGQAGSAGDGGQAIAARLSYPNSVAVDRNGNLYIADSGNHRVRMVDPGGTIRTVAGTGEAGFNGDGVATRAMLDTPSGLAIDGNGNVLIADTGNHIVRRLDMSESLTTVAGNRNRGFGGDGGAPLAASFDSPRAVALDGNGNLYIADTGNRRVRRVSPGTATGPGLISTFPAPDAAVFRQPRGLATDQAGNVYVSDAEDQRIFRLEPPGRVSTIAGNGWQGFTGEVEQALTARLDTPMDVAIDPAGNLYVADCGNNRIRRLIPNIEIPPPGSTEPQVAVLNGASLLAGPVAAGEIVSLFGTGLAVDGVPTQVLVNSQPVTVAYASASQVNVRLPDSFGDLRTADIQVVVSGVTRARAAVAVAEANPGLFTTPNGVIAVHEDGSLNAPGNPAPRGSIVLLFATGQGDGSLKASLKIGDYPAELLYAGPAPGFPGLMQLNARVPSGFAPPGRLPVLLQIGTAMSQAGVLIEVR